MTNVVVLNGGSSSRKSSLARSLQELLDKPWAVLRTDELLAALAPSLVGDAPPGPDRVPSLGCRADGAVQVDTAWWPVEAAWMAGVVTMARAGLRVILPETFLTGGVGQLRLAGLLSGVSVLWVGVVCDAAVAVAREQARPDRIAGMAAAQAATVHDGVRYDLVVDTTTASSDQCARTVLTHLHQRAPSR